MKLERALSRIATIHQQHSLKCALAMGTLKRRFDWPQVEWQRLEQLVDAQEPVFEGAILTSNAVPYAAVGKRRHWILAHGVYPYAYYTMLDWFNTASAESIFDHYLELCTRQNRYLSHDVSILLAFQAAWPLLSSSTERLRFIERFCEFVTCTFYDEHRPAEPLPPGFVAVSDLSPQRGLDTVLRRPGFWGHNVILLSWLLRPESRLNDRVKRVLLTHLHSQCHWQFDDPLDCPDVQPQATSAADEAALEFACRRLLLGRADNLHQITLAEAIVHLYSQPWVTREQQLGLLDVALHFSGQG
ncbi:hypothetical protein [Ferrimonas pelagia]|uniref:Uncharacterized protein n=1 Tax=Ferrimonas pelagia TaxID=1177826 RepID=A0ABP9FKY3_9GAMM